MQSFSADVSHLSEIRPELTSMKNYFDRAKHFPRVLISQNNPELQKAYILVPADIWGERVMDLQEALQSSKLSTFMRRNIVVARRCGMSSLVEETMDNAFLKKYEELMNRVIYDFDDFFPYQITRSNQQVMIFEKFDPLSMVQYVLRRL